MYMRTKRIIAKCEQHSGYGAGAGDTEYYEYECPCGKGTIIEEHDNIPGFREHSVYLHCTTCSKEYIIDTSAGTRNWKIVRKKVNRMKTQPYICRVHIENFRNFHSADFSLGEKQVLIGENAVGKSNLLYALQLILDPTLSEKDRMLEESDFWDGIENPMDNGHYILIEIYLANFEDNKNLLAQLADESVMVEGKETLKISYKFFKKDATKPDYSYIIYKGNDESRAFTYEDRKMLNIRVIKAIRDVEAEMKSSRTSPLTQIIKQKYSVSKSVLLEISKALDEKGADTLQIGQVNDLENRLQRLLNDMVSFSADEFSISLKTMNIDATKLLYALRPLINSRETGNTSLGINNILYVALILLLIEDDTIKTFLSGDLYRELIKQDHEHLLERSYEKSASSDDYALNLAALQDATLYDYRSSQTIVDASEYVLKSSRGYIASGKLRDYHAKLEFIECSKGMDEQYERVIEQISRFHTEGIPYHEIAVLVGNNKQVTELAQECSRQNIPAYIARQTFRLTDLIIWIQNCAKWVSDKCSVSFDEICSTWKSFISQKRIISEDDYFLLKRTIFQTLTASKVYKDNLSEWLCYLDKKVGIVSAFTASERYPDEIDNYNKLLETARSHDTQLTIKFLTRLGIPENQVVLTTRHSSKGLEFDVVILPGMEKDSFPSYYDNTPRKLAEARRLCFVSVSRARKACILIRSKNLQNQYGRWFSKEPSPFWVALQEFQDSRSDY